MTGVDSEEQGTQGTPLSDTFPHRKVALLTLVGDGIVTLCMQLHDELS